MLFSEKELAELVVVEGMMEAEIIKAKLTSFSIPSYLKFETAGRMFGITMNGLGKVRIMVPADRLAEAESILAEIYPDNS